ncbi:TetR/AcrR family transcriptional regulator [Neolewinella aurantiaca]|uniref:TetR/AcrR family transcriptional regulator n=1 Tax=Neolewinella aurantiaca TaxID=2602767 RepID=UPI00165026E0|nr:TetR/AcrR family transcriptional regulator [Neolewinella aurantiaca]
MKPSKVSSVLCAVNELKKNKQGLFRAASSMFRRLGIKSVSMDDLARTMGVSKKTLYQLVTNKEELVMMIMEEDFRRDMEVFADCQNTSHDAIDEFLRTSRYFIHELREISPAAVHDLQKYYPAIWKGMVRQHHVAFEQKLVQNIERGMEEGLYRNNIEPEVIATLYSGMMMVAVDRQVFPNYDRPLSEVIRQMTEYHFQGIVNQFGRDRLDQYLDKKALK